MLNLTNPDYYFLMAIVIYVLTGVVLPVIYIYMGLKGPSASHDDHWITKGQNPETMF